MMKTKTLTVDRVCFETARSFDNVLATLDSGIGRPNMVQLSREMAEAKSPAEFEKIIKSVIGKSDLMEFNRLDLGKALRVDPAIEAYRIVRIIAGNPLIMREMTRHLPDAGSYAPITILVYEKSGRVHICYDKMASILAAYGENEAIAVAQDLDEKVLKLLRAACSD